MKIAYFDANATSPVDPLVVEALLPYLKDQFGNPSSVHSFGARVKDRIEEARESLRQLLSARKASEIVFTSGATESNNLAFQAALAARPGKRHIITTSVEHSSVLRVAEAWKGKGFSVTYLPVGPSGGLDLDTLQTALRPDTALVSVMWVNNETGVIFPVEKIGLLLRKKGVLFHVDGVQAAGKVSMDVETAGIDLLSLSAHKFHGPKGAGILYVRHGLDAEPVFFGGSQEKGLRPGTENVPGIIGMGKAAELSVRELIDENTRVRTLRDSIEDAVKRIPGAHINGLNAPRTPNTLNVSFAGIEGEALLLRLDEEGVCASSGSACTAGSTNPSHVLKAMGIEDRLALASVRFSLSRFNTAEEVERLNELLPRLIVELRGISSPHN